MARVKVKMKRQGIRELMTSPEAQALVNDRAEAVADACNSQSSWGGYFSADASDAVRARARVWSKARQDNDDSSARVRRMVSNLDAQ